MKKLDYMLIYNNLISYVGGIGKIIKLMRGAEYTPRTLVLGEWKQQNLNSRPSSDTWEEQGQPGLTETLSQNTKQTNNNSKKIM